MYIDSEVMCIYWKIRMCLTLMCQYMYKMGCVSPPVHNAKLKIIYGLKMSKTADLGFRHYFHSNFTSTIILHKQHKKILSLGTCMEKCRTDTLEELQNPLWFLHHNTGAVRYFQEVHVLKNVVIVEPQYIFDN